MSETYEQMSLRHQKQIDAFVPKFVAFNQDQFEEGMLAIRHDPADRDSVTWFRGTGIYIPNRAVLHFKMLLRQHENQRNAAIAADAEGTGFIQEMFKTELRKHGFSALSQNIMPTLDALNIPIERITREQPLRRGLYRASQEIIAENNQKGA